MLLALVMVIVAVLGGYVMTSLILLKYPNLIHNRKKLKFKCRHISHRGGAGENYENTMTAFKRAVALGTDMLELDCQITKDSKVVVSHDQNLLRSTGVDCNISQLNYCDLPLLKPELPVDFDPGHTFVGSGKEEERRIVLLEEVFQMFPNVPINVDIKIDDENLMKEVERLIVQYNREEYTVWGNFSDKVTRKLYSMNPRVNLLFSMKQVLLLVLLLYTGLLPFVPIKETHLEIFLPAIYLRLIRKRINNTSYLPLHTFFVRSMDLLLMRRILFNHLEKRGIQTYLWVLNYEDEFRTAFELGASGVMTDYPSRLKKFLEENPQYQ
ncbi:lysophospholipase D GDPD1-like isoform X1 [Schistocerca serialis cubense]|uniref:lysophospholipase D GDPD1-like isoform X1 n=1 Tax=Schistocerca serialis cubense TaxID=2023355 RepID=UPI00214F4F1E|nr:lysophospholipase D GDPD1-like isoform X1 [Schistocerca serialis cubense]